MIYQIQWFLRSYGLLLDMIFLPNRNFHKKSIQTRKEFFGVKLVWELRWDWDVFGHLVIGNLEFVIGNRQLAINNWLLAEGNRKKDNW